jgi:hypothetical protein
MDSCCIPSNRTVLPNSCTFGEQLAKYCSDELPYQFTKYAVDLSRTILRELFTASMLVRENCTVFREYGTQPESLNSLGYEFTQIPLLPFGLKKGCKLLISLLEPLILGFDGGGSAGAIILPKLSRQMEAISIWCNVFVNHKTEARLGSQEIAPRIMEEIINNQHPIL